MRYFSFELQAMAADSAEAYTSTVTDWMLGYGPRQLSRGQSTHLRSYPYIPRGSGIARAIEPGRPGARPCRVCARVHVHVRKKI